jgi:hypothetical protein
MPEPDPQNEDEPARREAMPPAREDEMVGIGFFPEEVHLPAGWRFPGERRR